MKVKIKIMLIVFIICIITPLTFAKRKMLKSYDMIITPYFNYKNHMFFTGSNRYSESYTGLGIEGSLKLNKFLITSFAIDYGSLINVKTQGAATDYDSGTSAITNEDSGGERKIYTIKAKFEFFFYTNPENMFYFGPQFSYAWFGEMTLENNPLGTGKYIYLNSKDSAAMMGFFLGDRFLLFPEIVFNLEVAFSTPFFSTRYPTIQSQTKELKFKNYMIDLRFGIGTIFDL